MFSFFFFKQKTAYEMRISDWSSDVCSSDLSQQARDAGDEILVEWDNCGERLARRRRAEPQPMLARSVGDDDMASVDSSHVGKQRAQRARIDRDGRLKSLRCCVQNDRDGGQLRAPGDRLREVIRRRRERPTPSAERTPPRQPSE